MSDPEFDALMDAVDAATTREEKTKLFKEADLYFAANMYAMAFPPVVDALKLDPAPGSKVTEASWAAVRTFGSSL